MIKCNKKGEITFKGNVPDLMTDLSMIARATRELFMERGMSKDEAEEEFAFLVGRVAALEAVMNKDDSNYIEKEDVAAILGIEFKGKEE